MCWVCELSTWSCWHPIHCQTFDPFQRPPLGVFPYRARPNKTEWHPHTPYLIPYARTRGGKWSQSLVSEAYFSRWLSYSTHAMSLQLQQLVTEHTQQSPTATVKCTSNCKSPHLTSAQLWSKLHSTVVGNYTSDGGMSIASCQIDVRDYYDDLTQRPRPLEPVTERK